MPNPSNSNICLICVFGYYPSGNICAQVSKYCDGHNVETGACFSCKYGLQLSNGICLDSNCLRSANEICEICTPNYQIDQNGVCQFNDPNCLLVNGLRCENCANGYYITLSGSCTPLPNNCQFANIQTGGCIQCNSGFSISGS